MTEDEIGRRAFDEVLFTEWQKYRGRLMEDRLRAQIRGIGLFKEVLEEKKEFANGNALLEELIEKAVSDQIVLYQTLSHERPMQAGKERDAVLETPFVTPEPNGTDVPALDRPKPPRALPNTKNVPPKKAPGKKRGRPSKEEVARRKAAMLNELADELTSSSSNSEETEPNSN